jgi:hypothetical protein
MVGLGRKASTRKKNALASNMFDKLIQYLINNSKQASLPRKNYV